MDIGGLEPTRSLTNSILCHYYFLMDEMGSGYRFIILGRFPAVVNAENADNQDAKDKEYYARCSNDHHCPGSANNISFFKVALDKN